MASDLLQTLATPCLLLEHTTLLNNLRRMQQRMNQHGVALRPHLKTAKSVAVAREALALGAAGITVSTLREAEYFADHRITDITYAVGMLAARLPRVLALRRRGVDLSLITDELQTAQHLASAGDPDDPLPVLVEVDTGGQRAGVLPDSKALLEIARCLHQGPGTRLAGVLTHAGHSYHAPDIDAVATIAQAERDGIVTAATRLREAELPCERVSAGSTPTAVHATDLSGITEMRPGVYMFFDLDQHLLGSCQREDIALTVLSSVIGHNRHAGHLLLDAGALALSKDLSATEFRPEVGYGELCEPDTLVSHELWVSDLHQEHGLVPIKQAEDFQRLPVGSQVRIIPNHACITAAAYDHYQVLEETQPAHRWDRINGW